MVKEIAKIGFGQLEINNCAFRRDGRIIADCKATEALDNGILVAVDHVKKEVSALEAAPKDGQLAGILYSAEHNPADYTGMLREYINEKGMFVRVGLLSVGDIFTTNSVLYNDTDYADLSKVKEALKAGTPVYAAGGTAASNGQMILQKTAPAATVAIAGIVKEVTTMPDGQAAVKIVITKA